MTWTERLARLASGDQEAALRRELVRLQHGFVARAQRLSAHADQAPNARAESELSALAAAHSALAEAVGQALRERGAEPPVPLAPAANDGGRNHWQRLVADLEAARSARAELVSGLPRLLEHDPTLADLLDRLDAGLSALLLRLRALIARADPQALD